MLLYNPDLCCFAVVDHQKVEPTDVSVRLRQSKVYHDSINKSNTIGHLIGLTELMQVSVAPLEQSHFGQLICLKALCGNRNRLGPCVLYSYCVQQGQWRSPEGSSLLACDAARCEYGKPA